MNEIYWPLWCLGLSDKDISYELNIDEQIVSNLIISMMRKLGVTNRNEITSKLEAPRIGTQGFIYISYSPNDKEEMNDLFAQLDVIQGVQLWTDEKIPPGTEREEVIRNAINRAAVAVLIH